MYSFLSTQVTGRRVFKNSGIAVIGFLSAVGLAACSSGQTTAQEKSLAMVNFAYSLPAKSVVSVQSSNTEATVKPAVTAPKQLKPVVKASKVNYVGRAPHICTPSGFGSKPRCFSRS